MAARITPEQVWMATPDHFHKFVIASNGCWIWQGYRDRKTGRAGDTTCKIAGTKRKGAAYRLIWLSLGREIPKGYLLGFLCDGAADGCVNPNHLQAETMRDRLARSENTLVGRNLRMTHCAQGHEWTEENTYWTKRGTRQCRTCMRFYTRRAAEKYRDEYREAARERYRNDPRVRELTRLRQQKPKYRRAQRRRQKLARILNLRQQGMTVEAACQRMGIHPTTYYGWLKQHPSYRPTSDLGKLSVTVLAAMQEKDEQQDALRGKGSAAWDTSLDKPLGDDSSMTRGDLIAAPLSVEDAALADHERDAYLNELLWTVELRAEAEAIQRPPVPYIAERMDVSESTAEQLLADLEAFAAEHQGVSA